MKKKKNSANASQAGAAAQPVNGKGGDDKVQKLVDNIAFNIAVIIAPNVTIAYSFLKNLKDSDIISDYGANIINDKTIVFKVDSVEDMKNLFIAYLAQMTHNEAEIWCLMTFGNEEDVHINANVITSKHLDELHKNINEVMDLINYSGRN